MRVGVYVSKKLLTISLFAVPTIILLYFPSLTADENEKAYLLSNYPPSVWRYEGIAYYTYPKN